MYKNYRENKERVKLITNAVKEMRFQEEYKPFISDILLRRAFEYELSDEDILIDLDTLKKSLKNIIIEEPLKSDKKNAGIYYGSQSRILINEKILNYPNIGSLEILIHEVYHALCYTEENKSSDKLSWVNNITKEWNIALLEAIIEQAASRTIFEKGITEETPYYNNITNGYSNTTFAVNLICAAYGVKEKDFLKNAIFGKDRILDFLSKAGNENRKDALSFLNEVDTNLSLLHGVFYRDDDEPKLSKKEIDSRLRDGLNGLYDVCMNKFEERVDELKDKKDSKENVKFNFNKIHYIIDENLSKISKFGLSRNSIDCIDANIWERKRKVFSKICEIAGEKIDTGSPIFTLTDEMMKHSEVPEKSSPTKWNNEKIAKGLRKVLEGNKLIVYKNGETLLDKIKDLKGYYKHSDYRNLSEFTVCRMDVPKEYKSILVDVLLRRAYHFKQEPMELREDLLKMHRRLKKIELTSKSSNYDSKEKSLNIGVIPFLGNSKDLYEHFTYQTYKMLADEKYDENLKDDILYKCLLQRAVGRVMRDKPKATNPYYNNEKVKDDIPFAVELLSMTYGIPETDLLSVAIQGKDELVKVLSNCGIESEDKTREFLDKLNEKLVNMEELVFVSPIEQLVGSRKKDEEYADIMSDIVKLCVEKSMGVLDKLRRS